MEIDTAQFIAEIRNRPAIWDTKSPLYAGIEKIRQWDEITTLFTEPGISTYEKKEKSRILQNKWKNIRDAFMKDCRAKATVKSDATAPRTKYKYYNQLLFLKPVYAIRNVNQSSTSFDHIEDDPDEESHADVPPPAKITKKTVGAKGFGRELVSILKSLNQTDKMNEDPDRLFMLSLVPDFKKVPDRLKSLVKINLIKCLMEAQEDQDWIQPQMQVKQEYE